ncbi:MAG: hypothetical protein AAF485_01160 [Chloroflexota bacterium]
MERYQTRSRHLVWGVLLLLLGTLMWQPVLAQPALTSDWQTFVEPGLGFQVKYPAGWHVNLAADNTERIAQYGEHVALRSIGFYGPQSEVMFVDVWLNRRGKSLSEWVSAYPSPSLKSLAGKHQDEVAVVAGQFALREVDTPLDDSGRSPWHFRTKFAQDGLVFSVEYVSLNPNRAIYEAFLNSLELIEPTQQRLAPSTLTDRLPPASFGQQVATCCGITDFEFNPFPCNTAGDSLCPNPPCGNCTWWVRYRRQGGSEANLIHCTNDAIAWGGCVNTYYPHLYSDLPDSEAVVIYNNLNHLSYIEDAFGGNAYSASDLSWDVSCPVNYFNSSHTSNKSYVLHPDQIAANQPPNVPLPVEPDDNSWLTTREITLHWNDGGDPDDKPQDTRQYFTRIWQGDWFKNSSWRWQNTWKVEVPNDGLYQWRTKAYDGALESGWTEIQVVGIDTHAPTVSALSQPATGRWYNTEQTIGWAVSDGDDSSGPAYIQWAWNDDSPDNKEEGGQGTVQLSSAGQGQHHFYIQAWDQAGHQSDVSQWGWYGYDTVGPSVTINPENPQPNQWLNSRPNLGWSISDAGVGPGSTSWSWHGAEPLNHNFTRYTASPSASTVVLPAIQGQRTLHIKGRDLLGNEGIVETYGWFGYDTLGPEQPVIDPGCDALNNQWQNQCHTPQFSWQSVDRLASRGSGVADYTYVWGISPTPSIADWAGTTNLTPDPVATPSGWGKAYLHVFARDRVGNISSPATYGIWFDGSQPTASFSMNSNGDGSVQLLVEAQDTGSGPESIRVANNDQVWSDWQLYESQITWSLSATNSPTHTVYVQVQDQAGNESEVISQTVIETVADRNRLGKLIAKIEQNQPDYFGLEINEGAIYTNIATTTLTLTAPNVTEMRISNQATFVDQGWQPFGNSAVWHLKDEGRSGTVSTVYVWFRDAVGTVYGPYSDEIIYDTQLPRTRLKIVSSNASEITLLFDVFEDYSGITHMRFASEQTFANASWELFTNLTTRPNTGAVIYVQLRDVAGNLSAVYGTDGSNSGLTEKTYLPLVE